MFLCIILYISNFTHAFVRSSIVDITGDTYHALTILVMLDSMPFGSIFISRYYLRNIMKLFKNTMLICSTKRIIFVLSNISAKVKQA